MLRYTGVLGANTINGATISADATKILPNTPSPRVPFIDGTLKGSRRLDEQRNTRYVAYG